MACSVHLEVKMHTFLKDYWYKYEKLCTLQKNILCCNIKAACIN